MKQIGIPFQDDMALATYEGRKTLTSRLRGLGKINVRPDDWRDDGPNIHGDHLFFDVAGAISGHYPGECVQIVRCPYGQPGDVLIGRETWCSPGNDSDGNPIICYRASGDPVTNGTKWRSAMVMPWKYSRLHLEVVRVWLSRLQDMTEEMAITEGVKAGELVTYKGAMGPFECEVTRPAATALEAYKFLWDRINGKTHPWQSNPWVWRIAFRKIKP